MRQSLEVGEFQCLHLCRLFQIILACLTIFADNMILTGDDIISGVEGGRITIDPFCSDSVNPNSYNFHLSDRLLVYTEAVLDPRIHNPTREIIIPPEGLLLEPHRLYLGATIESIGTDHYVPLIFGRSSIARLGLFVEITAPLGDIGYKGVWTLQLFASQKIRIYPGLRIGQVLFFVPKGNISLYTGKYQNAETACASRSNVDFHLYAE